MVVVAESTRKLLGNLFELEDLGAQDLKGIAGPVRAWAPLRQASVESCFEALHEKHERVHDARASSNALASFRSSVSKPSVNQL
jgi:class 3 adenylate cyclase